MKMPTDAVAVYGNQFMIGCVDQADTENYVFSKGLFSTIDQLGLAVKENGQYNLAKSVSGNSRSEGSNMRTWIGHKVLSPSTVGDYDNDTFYELFYTPDEKVTLDDVMGIYRNRYEGTQYDADLPGNEGMRAIAVSTTPETHIVQIHDDYPTQSAAVTWVAPGGAEHSVFLPEFSGITDTAAAWKTDSAIYTENSVYWAFKKICGLADTDRTLYAQGVEDYWTLQEALMQAEMEQAGETVKALYAQDEAKGDAYVTELAAQMAEEQMANADHLYAELLTVVTHNNGLKSGKTPVTFEATTALRAAAELKGYTVGWDAASGAVTLTKGGDKIPPGGQRRRRQERPGDGALLRPLCGAGRDLCAHELCQGPVRAENRIENKRGRSPMDSARSRVEQSRGNAEKDVSCKSESPRQSFAARRRRKKFEFVFSKDMCLGKNTTQSASVRALRVRRSGLHPSLKNACIFEKKIMEGYRCPPGCCRCRAGRIRRYRHRCGG